MKRPRASAALIGLVLLVPTVLAVEPLVADSFTLQGTTSAQGEAAAVFIVFGPEADVQWEITASAATLTRTFAHFVGADHPTRASIILAAQETETGTETLEFGEITLASAGGLHGGALLARSEDASAQLQSTGFVGIEAVVDPILAQDLSPTARTSAADYYIREKLAGSFVEFDVSDGTLTLRGTLTLDLFGAHYLLMEGAEATEWRTGEFETSRTGPAFQGQDERHLLTLTDAVMRIRAAQPTTLIAKYATLDIEGIVESTGAQGALDLGNALLQANPEGALSFQGDAKFTIAPQEGRILAAAPNAPAITAAGGVRVAQGPPVALVGALALIALVGALAAIVVAKRRGREDDLEVALLAMADRRWDDALPRLARVAKKHPTDAGVLVDHALCLERLDRLEDAARGFEAALRAAPRHAEAHFYYARTLARMREREAARTHLEAALERDPRLAEMARGEAILRGL